MAKRNTAAKKNSGKAAAAPYSVLVVDKYNRPHFVTPAGLSNLLKSGSFGGDDAVAPRITKQTTARETTGKRTAAKTSGGANNLRGRVAGVYIAAKGKLPDDINPTTARVFQFIAKSKKKGITQQRLVKTSKLPNSTVWYALQNLKKKYKVIKQVAAA